VIDPESFSEEKVKEIREEVRGSKVIAAVSGGVDSTTAAVLAYRALGDRLIPVMLDTGFLRRGEAERVKYLLKDLLPLQVVKAEDHFVSRVRGLRDAEEKRKSFREEFYSQISTLASAHSAEYLVQGTIAADWVETQGGIKTQHNVLSQIGIDTKRIYGFKLLEPLADLYKDEVRQLATYLGLPKEITNRQPFPGPGLLVRVPGEISREKVELCRSATEIVERELEGLSQYFAVVFEAEGTVEKSLSKEVGREVKVYGIRATGVKGDVRQYGKVVSVNGSLDYTELRRIVSKLSSHDITHVLYRLRQGEGKYAVVIRAVVTEDFMTADFAEIVESKLYKIAEDVSRLNGVAEVLYDVTSKPPATIEFE
jgi:GMP synthase (glutamine-hydrolysing)